MILGLTTLTKKLDSLVTDMTEIKTDKTILNKNMDNVVMDVNLSNTKMENVVTELSVLKTDKRDVTAMNRVADQVLNRATEKN